jgi:hypothetical protein
MLKSILTAAVLAAVVAPAARAQAPAPAGVTLVIRDGRVTLTANQASIRQILAEWERQGQMKVTGADKITAAPVTLSLTNIPEKQALEIVMRGIPGYMAVDRLAAAPSPTASRYERVMVMARATTPVTSPPSPTSAGRAMPSQPQPAQIFTPEPAAPVGDEGVVLAAPDRSDVDQFQQAAAEPPMPETPVASPYPNAYPGSPYVGGGAGAGAGPYGGNATAAGASGAAPPETQFDYANPQKYFEQRRLQQQQQQQPAVPTAVPTMGTPVRGANGASPVPSLTPTAPGTLAQPGIAPTPQQATPTAQGEFFNPYNLPADWVPPTPAQQTGTPVEPDRSKYANPYEQPRPPGA